MTRAIRLILADDHLPSRGGQKPLIRRARDMRVVRRAESNGALMQALDNPRCDVLLVDLQRERCTFDDVRQLARRTKVLVLTASESVDDAITAMRLGAR